MKKLFGLFVLPTVKCNMDCPYCFTRFHPDFLRSAGHEIEVEMVNQLLDRICEEYDIVSFVSGGEPFLYERFPALLKILSQKSIACHIITNGTILDSQVVETLKEFDNLRLYISCHERWQETQSIVRFLREYLATPIVVSQIVTPENLHQAEDLSQFCTEVDCQFLPQLLGSIYNDRMRAQSYFSLSSEQHERAVRLFTANGRARFLERWQHWQNTGKLMTGCPNNNRVMVVYPSMNVYSCFFRGEDGMVGSLKEGHVNELWDLFNNNSVDTVNPTCCTVECNCLLEMPLYQDGYLEATDGRHA